ncbi:chromo domain-containing protein, partial [Mycobacterium kansasii]
MPTRPDLFSQPLPPIPNIHTPREKIEDILDHQIVSTSDDGFQKYLAKWKSRPVSDSTWLTMEELQRLDPDILKWFKSFISPVAKSSQPRRIDGDISRTRARTPPH